MSLEMIEFGSVITTYSEHTHNKHLKLSCNVLLLLLQACNKVACCKPNGSVVNGDWEAVSVYGTL